MRKFAAILAAVTLRKALVALAVGLVGLGLGGIAGSVVSMVSPLEWVPSMLWGMGIGAASGVVLSALSKGYRWGLYIARHENELVYTMQCDCVMTMIGYIIGSFADGGEPVEPWSLYLNFNQKHKTIKLGPEHFAPDGDPTPILIRAIESIDPDWQRASGKPVFLDVVTKKNIKICDPLMPVTLESVQAKLDNAGEPRELDFFDVMDEVFGSDRRDDDDGDDDEEDDE